MFGLSMLNPWKWGTIGLGIALALCSAWALRLDHLRSKWSDKYDSLNQESGLVLSATKIATNNQKLTWKAVPQQISALGESNASLKSSIKDSNNRIDELNKETNRLKEQANLFQQQLKVTQKERKTIADKLTIIAAHPGDKDCQILLKQADDALNIGYGANL